MRFQSDFGVKSENDRSIHRSIKFKRMDYISFKMRQLRVGEIAAYIGDLAFTAQKYYIAIRKKVVDGDGVRQVVKLPQKKEAERPVA